MHGRQRVERGPEEEAKRQKEREAKVVAYQHAMKKIFDKRSRSELDSDMLSITGQVLAANPDISTLWSIRKESLIRMKEADADNFAKILVQKELDFTEFCLKSNPKSYGAWHHRRWLMILTDFEKVAEELRLCSRYLEYDDRNFHVWDYRRFLLDSCELVTLDQELQFTTEKIASNFSNFSSWHLRSKLLPQLSKDFLADELDLIRNAVFTDPKDQSAWLYHLWLLKSQIVKEEPRCLFLELTATEQLIVVFNKAASNPREIGLKTNCDNDNVWTNPWETGRSKIWLLKLCKQSQKITEVSVSGDLLKQFTGEESLVLKVGERIQKFDDYFDDDTKPKNIEFETLLRDELSWVLELHDLEPEIKWPMHTAVILMRLISYREFKTEITQFVAKLLQNDPKRTNYYNDLLSKFTMEWILADFNKTDKEEINLSGKQLTALYYPERLCYVKKIDCSDNAIKNCASLKAFLSCKDINLTKNCIQNISNLHNCSEFMPNLKTACLLENPICGTNEFVKLKNDLADKLSIV